MRGTDFRIGLIFLISVVFYGPLKAQTGVAAPALPQDEGQSGRASQEQEGDELLLERLKWFADRHRGPDGLIPIDARLKALRQIEENLENGSLLGSPSGAIPGDQWSSIGPSVITDGTTPYSGRVTTMAAHSSDPNVAYVGTAQGGLWKTSDAGATWAPLTDSQKSLAVGSVAIDPSNSSTIYVGTGEANASCDAYFGAGILESTDGGATWTLLGESVFSNTSVSKVVIHPSVPTTLWASNALGYGGFICYGKSGLTYGVRKSTDGGATWTLVLGSAQTGNSAYTHDLVLDSSNPNVLYAAVDGSGVWKTTNGGTSWTKLGGGLPTSDIGRIDLAIKPSNTSVLYAVFEKASNSRTLGTYKTTNAGSSWSKVSDVPVGSTCEYWSLQDICTYQGGSSGQCNYDLVIEVAQNGDVWLGGLGVWRSSNEGATWVDSCSSTMHVDQHAFAFSSNGGIWSGSDGGAFLSTNGGGSFASRNEGLRTIQFYPGTSLSPASASLALGGSQDNGSLQYSGGDSWKQIYGGDGAFTAIDFTNPANVWYVSGSYLDIQKTTNGGSSVFPAKTGLTDAGTSACAFIAPYAMCPGNASVLVAGSDNVWRTNNGASSWSPNSADPLDFFFQTISAVAFAPSDGACNIYFAGLSNGKVFRTTTGGGSTGWTNITGSLPGRGVNDIAVSPASADVVYLALSGFGGPHLYKSTNALSGSPTWTAISAGLPDTPVNAVLVDPTDTSVVYIGTDVGLFRSLDAGTTWQTFMNGHPNVAVFDLQAVGDTQSVVSFTHGRGAFRLGTACTAPSFGGVTGAADASACQTSGILVTWDPPASWGQGSTTGTYEVRRYTASGCGGAYSSVASGLPASTTSYKDGTALGGQTYYYQVVATNNCSTPMSSTGTVSCSAAASDSSDITPCPSVGSSLLVSRGTSDANLSWTPVSCSDLAHYEVYGSASYSAPFPPGWTLLGTPATPAFADSLTSPWWGYQVVSVDSCGNRSGE